MLFRLIIITACFVFSFGFCVENQGRKVPQGEMVAGYNAPAWYDLRGKHDFFTTLTFLYWQAREEGLNMAMTNPSGGQFFPNIGGTFIDMHFKYKPGFKVGLGYHTNHDDWEIYAEYTRFHQTTSVSSASPVGGSLITLWLAGSNTGFAVNGTSTWNLELDMLDVQLARAGYTGQALIFAPHMGVRAYWLDQKYDVTYFSVAPSAVGGVSSVEANSNNKVDSWAIGPRFGLDTKWLLGLGFRLVGNASASLVYTHFKTRHMESNISNSLPAFNIRDNVSCLTPIIEMDLGIGWGTYLGKHRFHLDFEADYEFQVFWNQNRMNTLGNIPTFSFGGGGGSDLYFHGLRLQARFDF